MITFYCSARLAQAIHDKDFLYVNSKSKLTEMSQSRDIEFQK